MSFIERLSDLFNSFFERIAEGSSSVFPGLILIVVGFLVALLIGFLFRVLFKAVGVNRYMEKGWVSQSLQSIGVNLRPHVILGNIIFWVLFIFLVDVIADVSGWTTITSKFSEFTIMIPLLIGAVIIVAIGIYISKLISNITKAILVKANSKAAGILSNVVFYGLMIVVVTIALSFIGISTTIITANVSIILGSILLAFSISFVFGAKDLLKNILSSSYNKSNYNVGQKVEIDDFEGEIIKITNISVYVKSASKIRVIPAKRFTEDNVDIIG